MRLFLQKCLFTLVILISTVSVLITAGCGVKLLIVLIEILTKQAELNDLWTGINLYCIIGLIVSLAIMPLLYYWRRNLRTVIEFEDGMNKRFNSYSKLSKKERDKLDKERLEEQERILSEAELKRITHKGASNPEDAINHLIGLDNIKQELIKLAAKMEYQYKNKKCKLDTHMHMCLMGPPGTGKTTCARIIAGFLYKYKYIKKNQCIEVDGSYISESTQRTDLLLRKSRGGILFIDEAYTLYDPVILGLLVKFIEDNPDTVLILAGYTEEMMTLINQNPGLSSRLKYKLTFENYSVPDLIMIFKKMAKERGLILHESIYDNFEYWAERARFDRNFGNAREVRNVLDFAIDNHAYNLKTKILSKQYIKTLCKEDLSIDFINTNLLT